MIVWLLGNAIITSLCMITLWLLRNAPPRPRFFVAIAGMALWLVPIQYLEMPLPTASQPALQLDLARVSRFKEV